MDSKERLKRGKDHCFFIGVNDSGAELCKANTPYGMAGIHYVQELLGKVPDATFVFTPDMTITRNTHRWKSGFGYGGKLTWGDGNEDYVILNVKPNACGTFTGGLDKLPDMEKLIYRLYEIENTPTHIDGTKVEWDFYKSNHFIDLFELKPVMKTDLPLPPYAFIIHGSAPEFTGDNQKGMGLYHDKSKILKEAAELIPTPVGDFYILTGDNARKYFQQYRYADNFAKQKRRLAAELLFEHFTEIANETHQGMLNLNEIVLGCHCFKNGEMYPLMLRGDLPAYLVKGKPNLTEESIELLGFQKRAERLGVYNRLLNTNLIPHGGGYNLPDILGVNKVIEIDGKRYFEVEMQNDRGKKIISEVRELPYEYRGRNVVLRSLEVNLLDIVAKLIPKFVFKI